MTGAALTLGGGILYILVQTNISYKLSPEHDSLFMCRLRLFMGLQCIVYAALCILFYLLHLDHCQFILFYFFFLRGGGELGSNSCRFDTIFVNLHTWPTVYPFCPFESWQFTCSEDHECYRMYNFVFKLGFGFKNVSVFDLWSHEEIRQILLFH